MKIKKLQKLKRGDKVAILSPSFAAPAVWPHVFELGLTRLREVFELEPVEFPATKKLGAAGEERSKDLIDAFRNPDIKAVIATLGGDDQVTYVKNLNSELFLSNPKPFFGFSDNTHFCNFLFLNGIPSYYGACLFTQFAMQKEMDAYTVEYITHALFDEGEFELTASNEFNDIPLTWEDPANLSKKRIQYKNDEWYFDGPQNAEGILWGGCLESVDEMLRHGVPIPTLEQFTEIVLMLETSEEIPSHTNVRRVIRALGERGILERVQGILMGRPQTWDFDKQVTPEEGVEYRKQQRETILSEVRKYNKNIPVIQNMDFGHTNPQIPMPLGNKVRIDAGSKRIWVQF